MASMALTRRTLLALPLLALPVALAQRFPELVWWTPRELPDLPKRLTRTRMAELFGEVECEDEKVERVWVHPRTAADFPFGFKDLFDPEYQSVLLQLGIVGSLWGADVRTNEAIPEGEGELVGTADWDSPRNTWLCETTCPAPFPPDWDLVVGGTRPGV